MTKLLEIKKQIFHFCGKYEAYLKFVYKFIIALVLFVLINETIGFMESISTLPVALVLALVCCVLPQSMTLLVAVVLIVIYRRRTFLFLHFRYNLWWKMPLNMDLCGWKAVANGILGRTNGLSRTDEFYCGRSRKR